MRLSNPWSNRWVRVVAATLGALFLVPIPGLALTFLSPWTVISNVASGPGVPMAIVTALADGSNGKGPVGRVLVNMGNVDTSKPGSGGSTVTIQRKFSVDDIKGEHLQYTPNFSTELQNSSATITAVLGRVQNNQFTPLFYYTTLGANANGNKPVTFEYLGTGFISPTMPKGSQYALRITVAYSKRGNGHWRYKNISPHKFEFSRA
jgi:hypothetical protein